MTWSLSSDPFKLVHGRPGKVCMCDVGLYTPLHVAAFLEEHLLILCLLLMSGMVSELPADI